LPSASDLKVRGKFTGIYVEKDGCTDVYDMPCQNFTAPAWIGLDHYLNYFIGFYLIT
jgi:hypothetical protein